MNTFLPVLECLLHLHGNKIVHGSVSSESIVFDEEGDVKLRDWMLEVSDNKYYEVEKFRDRDENDDINALGNVLL